MDDETGFNVVPARYQGTGREKIDQIRDSMSDTEFAVYCRGTAMKYDGRDKGPEDAEKRRWYLEMADHVLRGASDPRRNRQGFAPYQRASMPEQLPEVRIALLDHGFVRFVEDWGGGDTRLPEAGIIEAARQSTQGNFRGWKRDRQLLQYLHEHKHSTPFEFAGMTLEIRAPIFVFREWHRHRTQSYSEMSARYSPLPDMSYMPTLERLMIGTGANKQAGTVSGAPVLTKEGAVAFQGTLADTYDSFEEDYQAALATGVPKELARCGMPVGRYSQMRATANLRNWLGFLTLRMDPAAQWEIRQYASAVHHLVTQRFPQTASLFTEPT